jgi:hypothetical protein
MNRRVFLKNSFLTVALLVFSKGNLFATVTPIQTIALLQEDLFPLSKQLHSNSASYVSKILHHTKISKETKQFIRNGVKWLNEESVAIYGNIYTKLSDEKRQAVLQTIAQVRWGDRF